MKRKRIFSVIATLLVSALIISAMPITAFSAEMPTSGDCGDTLHYSFNEETGTLTITGDYAMWASASGAFTSFSSQVKAIELPEGLTKISVSAFRNFTQLTEITIPSTVTEIADDAFYGCESLAKVVNRSPYLFIVKGETTNGYVAYYATELETILKPYGENLIWSLNADGLLKIQGEGDMVYYNSMEQPWYADRTKIFSLSIADTVTSISDDAFYGCEKLTEVNIPDSVESIGSSAFSYCTSLKKVTIGSGVTTIGRNAFNLCESLAEITVPANVTSIDADAFYGCDTELVFKVVQNSAAHTYALTNGYKVYLTYVNAPAAPTYSSKTDTTVTLVAQDGYEYSKDGETWQTSNEFTGLSPNTPYTFYQRVAATDTANASEKSEALTVTTDKSNVAKPEAPTYSSKTDTTVTLVAQDGYEYSKDGETWQTSNEFTGLSPNTPYTFYQRVAATDTSNASEKSDALTVTTDKSNVAKPEAPTYSSKTDTTVTLVAQDGYEYSKDGETWQISNVFEGLSPNTPYTFYQRVAATDTSNASEKSDALTVTTDKSNVAKPEAPTYSSKTDTTVTLVAQDGYEYSKDGETWQISNEFTGLSPNTPYTFYQRVAATDTSNASEKSDALTVTTDKSNVAKPEAPTYSSKTDTTVTLVAQDGYEYSKDGETWQISNVFEGLSPNTPYTFYQRVAATDTANASESSEALSVTTKSVPTEVPAAPTVAEKTDTTVTLNAIEGYQYSKDGENWQDSNEFTGLAPNTSYSFYQRIAETDDAIASASSEAKVETTNKSDTAKPDAPTYSSKTDTTVTLDIVEGCEYSKDGVNWQDSNVFIGLSPAQEYTFYQRVKATDTANESASSEGLTVTTNKSDVAKPDAPTLSGKTDTTVTLTEKAGYEYSIDGINWYTDNVFTGLTQNTSYTFYQRVAETTTSNASASSEGLTVTTKAVPEKPAVPIVADKTDTTVTLTEVSGYEYKIEGGQWQTSNVFENLNPNASYNFYQRKAETEDAIASASSEALTVITKAATGKPNPPTLSGKTDTTVTLLAIAGYEYKIEGGTWQDSNIFTGLSPAKEYKFYQRVKATETVNASEISDPLTVTTNKSDVAKPAAPTLSGKTDTTVTLNAVEGYQYSKDGENWQDSNVFIGLSPAKEYTFYQMVKATDTANESVSSDALTVTTNKSDVAKPAAPTLSGKTDTTVTLNAVEGYQYSKDGENWQDSNVFIGLSPAKEYTFYQMVKATDTANESEISDALTVTTEKSDVAKPAKPTLSGKTDTTVTLTEKAGYEYSKDGTTWQTSNVFTGLSQNTSYTFYQRVAETDTEKVSVSSDGLTVKTDETVPSSTTSTVYTVAGTTVSKITSGTTVSALLSGLSAANHCKVYKGDNVVSGTENIGTGMVVKIMDGNTVKASYTVIVTGDVDGDGNINISDMLLTKSCILGKTTLKDVYATAADTSGDGKILINDFLQIKSKILRKSDIVAR